MFGYFYSDNFMDRIEIYSYLKTKKYFQTGQD